MFEFIRENILSPIIASLLPATIEAQVLYTTGHVCLYQWADIFIHNDAFIFLIT